MLWADFPINKHSLDVVSKTWVQNEISTDIHKLTHKNHIHKHIQTKTVSLSSTFYENIYSTLEKVFLLK